MMKMRAFPTIAIVLAGCLLATASPAADAHADPTAAAADALLVRPLCLVATVVGSAIFVVSLPFAAASKSVKQSANTFVKLPAQATFKRPIGDFSQFVD